MLTAKASEIDRVLGLELGADDYVPSRSARAELVLRVKALLRRGATVEKQEDVLHVGELVIDIPGTRSSRRGSPSI